MKIYLDDMRPLPAWAEENNWILVGTYDEIIKHLKTGKVTEVSLDHDLGLQPTGYDILLWIEEKVVNEEFVPPAISIYTMNLAVRGRMEQAVDSIWKKYMEIK